MAETVIVEGNDDGNESTREAVHDSAVAEGAAETRAEQATEAAADAEAAAEQASRTAQGTAEAAAEAAQAAAESQQSVAQTQDLAGSVARMLDEIPNRIAAGFALAMKAASDAVNEADTNDDGVVTQEEITAADNQPGTEHWWFRKWGRRND